MTKLLDELAASGGVDTPFFTLEFSHSAFRDAQNNPTSIRLVQGYESITAKDEKGVTATYQPSAITLNEPQKGAIMRQELGITIDAASGEIYRQLNRVSKAVREPIYVVMRVFVSSDLTKPHNTPIKMTVLNPTVTATTMQCRASFADVVNQKFPSKIYTIKDFPGLASV